MYFNYEVINMRSTFFFFPPSPNVVRNTVQMQLYIYLTVSIPVQGFLFNFIFVIFFPDSSVSIYVISDAGPGKNNISFCTYKLP